MPIYAYRCDACGFAKDVLQKVSDAPLTDCPECGKSSFKKQLTAAGFQLKGTGWYVTDFRNNGNSAATAPSASGTSEPAAKSADASSSSGSSGGSSSTGSSTSTGSNTDSSAAPA